MKQNTFGFVNPAMDRPMFLQMYDFGLEDRKQEVYDFRNHTRQNYGGYLLQYTLEGEGIFTYQEKKYKMTQGAVFFIPIPHQSRYYLPKESAHWKFFFLHFDGEFVKQFYAYIINQVSNVFFLPLNAFCVLLFLQEYQKVSMGKKYENFENGAFLYTFLEALCTDIKKPFGFKNQSWVEEAKAWMEYNIASGKNITDMSKEMNVSASHLTRQFHMQTGMTPMQYFMKLKMEHAIFLLLNTSLPVIEIARQTGFSNGNYFSKVFRRFLKMPPQKYRNSYIQKGYKHDNSKTQNE